MCTPRSLSLEAKKRAFHIDFYTETVEQSDYIKWNDLAWNDLTVERGVNP